MSNKAKWALLVGLPVAAAVITVFAFVSGKHDVQEMVGTPPARPLETDVRDVVSVDERAASQPSVAPTGTREEVAISQSGEVHLADGRTEYLVALTPEGGDITLTLSDPSDAAHWVDLELAFWSDDRTLNITTRPVEGHRQYAEWIAGRAERGESIGLESGRFEVNAKLVDYELRAAPDGSMAVPRAFRSVKMSVVGRVTADGP